MRHKHEKTIMGSNLTWVRGIHDFYKPLNHICVERWENRRRKVTKFD